MVDNAMMIDYAMNHDGDYDFDDVIDDDDLNYLNVNDVNYDDDDHVMS